MPIAGLSADRAGPSQTPSRASSDIVFMREQVCSSEEVHCGSVRSTAGDGGTSDTRTTQRLYRFIKREHIDMSVALRES